MVEFASDVNSNGQFDSGDTFQPYINLDDVLTNLELYLVPAGTNDVGEFDILVSQSTVSPVQHLFGEIPFTGEYELWVYRNKQFAPDQNYGLAWWYGLAPPIEPPTVTGDFDGNGDNRLIHLALVICQTGKPTTARELSPLLPRPCLSLPGG